MCDFNPFNNYIATLRWRKYTVTASITLSHVKVTTYISNMVASYTIQIIK